MGNDRSLKEPEGDSFNFRPHTKFIRCQSCCNLILNIKFMS